MKIKLKFFLILSALSCVLLSMSISSCQSEGSKASSRAELIISEFMCSNKNTIKDKEEKSSDWIELTNLTNDTLFLNGYSLSDDANRLTRFTFSSGFILPRAQEIYYASGEKNKEGHLNFKLDKSGGDVFLINPGGEILNQIKYLRQFKDMSFVFVKGEWNYSKYPSPREVNNSKDLFSGIAPAVNIRLEKRESQIQVILSADEEGEIKYTTDGSSAFSDEAKVYKSSFLVDSNQVITAALFSETLITKRSVSAVYVDRKAHSLPVLSLVTDPKNLWSDSTGVFIEGLFKNYENRSDSCERKASIQYFAKEGEVRQQSINFKIYGAGTRGRPKKSMTFKPRGGEMPNWFFSSNKNEYIDGFVVRACYSDASRFKNEVVKGVNDIMGSDLLMQEYMPSVLYVNGEYWGLYNIYERKNDDFITAHTGKKVRHLLNGNSRQAKAERGSNESYNEFLDQLNVIDIKSVKAFELIQSEVELGSFMDFWVNELFTLKADRFNNRFWKTKEEDAKWSYVGYDFDIGFVWPINPRTKKNFSEKEAMGIEVFGKCIQNTAFATHFFKRLSDFMNFGYTPEEVGRILSKADSLTKEEFKRDYTRWSEEWPKCLDKGDEQVKKLTKFVSPRSTYLRDSIAPIFGFDKQVLIKNSVPGQADVFVNGYKMKDEAIYFNDMDISIELKFDSGYFHWEKDGEKVELTNPVSFSLSTVLELKPSN
jgi:hypothetical protein